MSKKLFVSDVIGPIVLTDHDLRTALKVAREISKVDKPEGMAFFDLCVSATLLTKMLSAYIKAKKSSKKRYR